MNYYPNCRYLLVKAQSEHEKALKESIKNKANFLRFFNLFKYMENMGFLPIDLVDLTNRKKDNLLCR